MPLTPTGIADLVATTQSKFIRGSWVDLSHSQPQYIATRLIAEMGVTESGGVDYRWLVNKSTNGNAQTTGFFRQVAINVDDSVTEASMPWRFQITGYGYDDREALFNRGKEKIISELKLRDINARGDLVKLMEELFWGAPTSTSDTDALYGVTFWIQKDTTSSGGFNGANPSTHSSGAGGIDSNTVTAWRNWAAGYTNPTVNDLIRRIKLALANTDFQAPIPTQEAGFGKAVRCGYAEYNNVIEPLEREAEQRNQNLQGDLAMYMNEVTVARIPIKKAFWLQNNDSTYPVYFLNHEYFRPVIQEGLNMARLAPQRVQGQPHGWRVHTSHSMNWACLNRREGGFVISK